MIPSVAWSLLLLVPTAFALDLEDNNDGNTTQKYVCDPGWMMWRKNNQCYIKILTSVNWHQGEASCQKWGGHLTSIHSEEENNFVYMIARIPGQVDGRKEQNYFAWIGLIANGASDIMFSWSDGTPNDYVKWQGRNPNSGSKERCVQLRNDDGRPGWGPGQWNNLICHGKQPASICKKPARKL